MATRVVICLFRSSRKSLTKSILRSALKKGDSRKKQAQPKETDNIVRRDVKVNGGATKEECVAGPIMTRAQAKKGDKKHSLKVKESMSSVDKSAIEDLQKKLRFRRSILTMLGS